MADKSEEAGTCFGQEVHKQIDSVSQTHLAAGGRTEHGLVL
jgi:hypothetical protein